MLFRLAADAVIVLHAAFIAFVVLGGLLVARWPRLMWAHIPAAVWGAFIEFAGWICPLTPLENELRYRGGLTRYEGDFVEQYLLPILYPEHLSREIQFVLGALVIVLNVVAYWYVGRRSARAADVSHGAASRSRRDELP
jgi:hypothetical protein